MQAKTSPHHRVCKYPKCKNILSIYNHEVYCNIHLNPSFWKDKVGGEPVTKPDPLVLSSAHV